MAKQKKFVSIILSVVAWMTLSTRGLAQQESAPFPTGGILPKEETGAARFLQAFPEYDGRGIIVAILDTGVDPGAPGLQTTPDGKPKIIDLVDGTGSGDVDTATIREVKDGAVKGLSGKTLNLGTNWSNPSGKYHVGLKRGYELFPKPLVSRLKEKRKEKWDEEQRALVTKLQREILLWDEANPKASEKDKRKKKDLEVRLEQLQALQKNYDDPGPIFDCVVFHDGKSWRAVIDTDEDADLGDETALANYREEKKYGTFGKEDLLNFAVNIYEEGKLLSIVVDSGMHGTHVAGIVGAYFPDQPELNGVAPGVQIVSVKIGDTRLDGMETPAGLVRGLAAVRRNQCQLINLSYGEPPAMPNTGRLIHLLSDIVNERGVIFVAAAMNNGPALSTVGAPGGTSSALIGVGAYLSPEMMRTGYSMREKLAETQYTWSSRGPTFDGDLGVSISAPGGAIAPVPTWTLQRNQLANGTSMAAPNACGAIALLLSGLKAEKISYSPYTIRRFLENSARKVEGVEVFAQGRGLIQIDKAYELLKQAQHHTNAEPRYEITIPQRQNARGILLREPSESTQVLETTVNVDVVFPKETENRQRVEFEKRFRLESTAPWVQTPEFLFLMYGGRDFGIKVDPTELEPGAHYAEVCAFDVTAPQLGPVFRVPITAIRNHTIETKNLVWEETIRFEPAKLERRFFAVPQGATWAELTVRANELESPRRLVVHAQQILPMKRHNESETQQYLTMNAFRKETVRFPVAGGRTLELCLGQLWSSLGEGEFEFTLDFQGIVPSNEALFLDGSALLARAEATAVLEATRLAPRARLTTLRRSVNPTKAEIRPLSDERDMLPKERQLNELILTYSFKQEDAGSITPLITSINRRLYDAEFEAQLWMVFDAAKRLVAVDDSWNPGPVTLEEGDYVIRFQVRHDDVAMLEKLKEVPLQVDIELASSISLDCYRDPDQALTGGAKFSDRRLEQGSKVVFYVAAPAKDKLPKRAKAGDFLIGSIKYEDGAGAPDYALICSVLAQSAAEKGKSSESKAKEKNLRDKLAEERRDLQLAHLDKLDGEKHTDAFNELMSEMLREYPNYLPVLQKQLHRLDSEEMRDYRRRSIVAAADQVLEKIDRRALAAYFGVRRTGDEPEEQQRQQEMEKQKEALVDALYRKCRALAFMELPPEEGEEEEPKPENVTEEPPFDKATVEKLFEEAFAELQQWVDTKEDKYFLVHIRRDWRHERFGEVLKVIQEKLKKPKSEQLLYKKRMQVYKDLGWKTWEEYERKWLLVRFPKEYPKF